MSKTTKELADELDARDRLKRRGYRQITCAQCNGIGQFVNGRRCYTCDGKGYRWEAPLEC